MQSIRVAAASIGFASTMIAAGIAVAQDTPLGTRLVDQMNALYGVHPGVRANHATGAVFEGIFTPAKAADQESASASNGGPAPIVPSAHARPTRGPAADMRAKRQRGSRPARKRASDS